MGDHYRRRILSLAGLLLAASAVVIVAQSATAANSPTYRDCSFSGGVDPDYVTLMDTTPGSQGMPTVPPSQTSVHVKASESSDPGDSSGHDTFKVTVSAPGHPTKALSGADVGKVILTVPLDNPTPGTTYTLDWAATFDNGNHSCPGSQTPQNVTPMPFMVTVAGSGTTTTTSTTSTATTTSSHPRHKRRHCRRHGKHACHRTRHG